MGYLGATLSSAVTQGSFGCPFVWAGPYSTMHDLGQSHDNEVSLEPVEEPMAC